MNTFRRLYMSGGCYFFTVVTYQRRPLLCSKHAIQRLRAAFRYVMKRHPFRVLGVVILPDHLHCIWQLPQNDSNFSIRWSLLKNYFSKGMSSNVNKRRSKEIWQPRFWEHFIRNEEDLQKHLDYIHYNPVKHGYVNSPLDWPHSSFKRAVANGVYDAEWGEQMPNNIVDVDFE